MVDAPEFAGGLIATTLWRSGCATPGGSCRAHGGPYGPCGQTAGTGCIVRDLIGSAGSNILSSEKRPGVPGLILSDWEKYSIHP